MKDKPDVQAFLDAGDQESVTPTTPIPPQQRLPRYKQVILVGLAVFIAVSLFPPILNGYQPSPALSPRYVREWFVFLGSIDPVDLIDWSRLALLWGIVFVTTATLAFVLYEPRLCTKSSV